MDKMKTLTLGNTTFEIVDEQARTNVQTHADEIVTLSANLEEERTRATTKEAELVAADTTNLQTAKSYTDTKIDELPDWTKAANKPTYTASEIGSPTVAEMNAAIAAIPTPDVSGQIGSHNTATDTHNDIRLLIEGLTTRLNTLANSDDTTLDQMAEIVAYIKSNRSLIEEVTTNKINVSDIINNLTTNVSNKPLSAAQGVALKALIDAITIPTKVSELTNDKGYLTSFTETDPTVPAWAKASSKPTYTASEVGASPTGHKHTKSEITDFPTSMTPTSHASTHKSGGSDALSPEDIGALPLSGGTMTGAIKIGQDNGNGIELGNAGRIMLGSNCVVGVLNGEILLGSSGHPCLICGNKARPTYNGADMALQSDIPSVPTKTSQLTNDSGFLTEHQSLADYAKKSEVPTKTETWTFTLEDGSTVTKAVYVG